MNLLHEKAKGEIKNLLGIDYNEVSKLLLNEGTKQIGDNVSLHISKYINSPVSGISLKNSELKGEGKAYYWRNSEIIAIIHLNCEEDSKGMIIPISLNSYSSYKALTQAVRNYKKYKATKSVNICLYLQEGEGNKWLNVSNLNDKVMRKMGDVFQGMTIANAFQGDQSEDLKYAKEQMEVYGTNIPYYTILHLFYVLNSDYRVRVWVADAIRWLNTLDLNDERTELGEKPANEIDEVEEEE